jgi:hypothetical protein
MVQAFKSQGLEQGTAMGATVFIGEGIQVQDPPKPGKIKKLSLRLK